MGFVEQRKVTSVRQVDGRFVSMFVQLDRSAQCNPNPMLASANEYHEKAHHWNNARESRRKVRKKKSSRESGSIRPTWF